MTNPIQPLPQQLLRYVPHWLAPSGAAPLLVVHPNTRLLDEASALLTKAALCETDGQLGCGTCLSCRAADGNRHTDVTTLAADTTTITIKHVRSLIHAATQGPLRGTRRILVVPQAERLSLPAANAMLKVLEEAPITTRFLLTTRWRQRLLPTILSRSLQVTLRESRVPTPHKPQVWESDVLERLVAYQATDTLSDELLLRLAEALAARLRSDGATPTIRRAYQRLRDYCAIREHGTATKTARDVLLASLPD